MREPETKTSDTRTLNQGTQPMSLELLHVDGRHTVSLNLEQRLYVIPAGNGYSCLGFDVCADRLKAYTAALAGRGIVWPVTPAEPGTVELYRQYLDAIKVIHREHDRTGWRCLAELTPELIGLEGKRVEVVDKYGERRRFKVGKSTGWIPCHLELANRRSSGGGPVFGAPFQSIRVVS